MKLYLDNCCYNRPFDDQTQDRIHIESEAVLAILKGCENGMFKIFSSPVLRMEIDKYSNEDKRGKVLALYSLATPDIPFTEEPPVWFHDLFHVDGTPWNPDEVLFIRSLTEKNKP